MTRRKRKDEPERFCAACSRKRSAHPVTGRRWDNTEGMLCAAFVSLDAIRGKS